MKQTEGRISVKTLAKLCGVSIGSVDRALHNRSGISAQTRKKILDKAQELGYRPNLPARSLVTGKTHTIGVVVFDLLHPFSAQLVTAIITRLREDDYFSSVTVSGGDRDEERRCLEQLTGQNVDGVILIPINKGRKFNEYLAGLNRPIVTVVNSLSKSWPHVGVDYMRASSDAVEYVASRCYKRIVYLCPYYPRKRSENSHAIAMLVRGYETALARIGNLHDPILISGDDYIKEIGELRFSRRARTAILCSNDSLALEVLTFLSNQGVRTPDDVGVMGFDNIAMLRYVHPPLATIDCAIEEIGTRSAECLLGSFNGEYCSPIVEHQIIPGETL